MISSIRSEVWRGAEAFHLPTVVSSLETNRNVCGKRIARQAKRGNSPVLGENRKASRGAVALDGNIKRAGVVPNAEVTVQIAPLIDGAVDKLDVSGLGDETGLGDKEMSEGGPFATVEQEHQRLQEVAYLCVLSFTRFPENFGKSGVAQRTGAKPVDGRLASKH